MEGRRKGRQPAAQSHAASAGPGAARGWGRGLAGEARGRQDGRAGGHQQVRQPRDGGSGPGRGVQQTGQRRLLRLSRSDGLACAPFTASAASFQDRTPLGSRASGPFSGQADPPGRPPLRGTPLKRDKSDPRQEGWRSALPWENPRIGARLCQEPKWAGGGGCLFGKEPSPFLRGDPPPLARGRGFSCGSLAGGLKSAASSPPRDWRPRFPQRCPQPTKDPPPHQVRWARERRARWRCCPGGGVTLNYPQPPQEQPAREADRSPPPRLGSRPQGPAVGWPGEQIGPAVAMGLLGIGSQRPRPWSAPPLADRADGTCPEKTSPPLPF
ncbi:basic salivary proline-rich protein 1-like [Sphaerodactylus townsendi]|uniref:basic salivary proline-rich protein 1-like n=1 Tax=Sphaerodactylus townsendi TaxID=933632 RepID=UPI002025F72C|nr:basic salivary proline-rich protein 1-like [Sphaerodactylus townsendi]XP_048357826.1 basic salivary proline-rich protein 1-like [Sphaerodactylus townsendi]